MILGPRLKRWLFRAGQPETAPILLTQRRIFVVPARGGLLFAVVLTVMYLAAVNYNLGLGHALVFLLAALGHTGLIHTFRNLYGLRVVPGRAPPVFVGETAEFTVRFENDRAKARVGLAVKREGGEPTLFEVPADGCASIEIPIPTLRRGWHPLGRLTLSTTYPLGLFYAWSHPHPDLRCLVYPHPLSHPLPFPSANDSPSASGNLPGDDDFSGFRARQPGDSPRHVAWKAFARDPEHRPLLVKQFTGGAEPELWLDWEALRATHDAEARLSILTGWVLAADARGARYGLRLPGRTIAPEHGQAHRSECLRTLALFETVR